MKIIITEEQANRLNLLPAKEDPISKVQRYTNLNEPILDNLFNELINLTLMEIINDNYNFEAVGDKISMMESESRKLHNYANDWIETQPEDDNYDLDNRLYEADRKFDDKLTIIEDLINGLSKLKENFDENDILSKFTKSKQIEI